MKRWIAMGLALASVSVIGAQEERVWTPRPMELPPFQRVQTTLVGKAGRDSRVVAVGDGASPLAIYVYDRMGQCIALDDDPSGPIDDRVAVWVTSDNGPFDVQIRNVGPVYNRLEASAR